MSSAFASHGAMSAGLTFGWTGASAQAEPALSLSPEIARVNDSAQGDLERVQRIGSGDQRAYRQMVDQYLPSITRFAERILGNRGEAEEVAQETFLKLWTAAARFTPRAQPKTWLYRIARNQCIDQLRKRHETTSDDDQASADRPSLTLLRKQTAQLIEHAMQALPERQRAAITLIHYEGLDSTEACEVLEVSLDALESLLARGRRSLREQLRELGPKTEKTP
jgi:RNA polymerase sigma-70 factor (ECF subfamily)